MSTITGFPELWNGAADGVALSTSNTAADNISGTATGEFDSAVTYNGHNTAKFIAAANSKILRFDHTAAGGWRWFPFRQAAFPAASVAMLVIETSGGTKCSDLRMQNDGTLQLRDAGSVSRWTSSTVLAANTTYWIAVRVNSSANGGHRVKIYNGTTGALIEDSGAQTNSGFSQASPARVKIGPQSSTTWTIWYGELGADTATEPTPPVAESADAIISDVTTVTTIDGSTSDGDTVLTQLTGPSCTITETGTDTNIWEVEYAIPLASDIELRLRATSSGGTVTDDEFYTIGAGTVTYSPVSNRKTFDGTVWKG